MPWWAALIIGFVGGVLGSAALLFVMAATLDGRVEPPSKTHEEI